MEIARDTMQVSNAKSSKTFNNMDPANIFMNAQSVIPSTSVHVAEKVTYPPVSNEHTMSSNSSTYTHSSGSIYDKRKTSNGGTTASHSSSLTASSTSPAYNKFSVSSNRNYYDNGYGKQRKSEHSSSNTAAMDFFSPYTGSNVYYGPFSGSQRSTTTNKSVVYSPYSY